MQQGLYGWFSKNLKGRKGQQGFTLIELLVVVTILGVLAAIVTLSLVGLTTRASINTCNSEYKTVQAAIDAYMAAQNVTTLGQAQAHYTQDMTGGNTTVGVLPAGVTPNGTLALFNPAPTTGSPNFTRNGATQYYYEWDTSGKITHVGNGVSGSDGIASDAAGTPVNGCTPR
jgi:prepilin-type N-terminal cleavage/methylation domain-containing protein